MALKQTSFRKFTELELESESQENEDEEIGVQNGAENNIQEAKTETPKDRSSYPKRKPKDLNYKECKTDLTHLLYIDQKLQVQVPHSLHPNLNLMQYPLPSETDLGQCNFPHCNFTAPRPVYYAKNHCENFDKCFRRPLAREHHRKRLSYARTTYQNTLQNNRKIRKLVKEKAYQPSLFTFAERLECDPDPFFYGNYDFYYTGGNICVLAEKYGNVLHVDGKDSNIIKSSVFPTDNDLSTTTLKELNSKQLAANSEIFHLSPMEKVNNLNNLVAARQLNNITVISVEPTSGKLKLLTEFKSKSTPFVSFAQSTQYPELLAMSTMTQSVRLYDISQKQTSIKNLYKMHDDNSNDNGISWNCIKPWENQIFLYATERQLCVMDFRTPQEQWLNTRCTFSLKEFPCELISSLAPSSFSNLFYMGTSHKLCCVDIRSLGQGRHFENVTVCEWTHQLDFPAVYLDTYQRKNREIIACASPLAGDVRICELSSTQRLEEVPSDDISSETKFNYNSFCLPWLPPTLQEAFDKACLTGKALQPEANLKQRIRCCTTGLSFFKSFDPKNVQALLLQTNSNGDIYAQNMFKRETQTNVQESSTRSDEIIADYASKLSKLTQPDLNHTDVVNLKAMRKVLLCPALNRIAEKTEANIPEEEKKEKPQLKYNFKGRWQKSMSTLHKYKDALAQNLLSIWDIPFEEELDIKLSTLKKKFKKEKDHKDILNWLNAGETQPPTTKIPMANLSMTSMEIDQEDFELTQRESVLNETTLTHVSASVYRGDETLPNSTYAKAKSKTTKSKKKHVKGF